MNTKESNPKNTFAAKKFSLEAIPLGVLANLGLAMMEGALKYGKFNWRESGASANVYCSAAKRHIDSFLLGEDVDPDSGIHHLIKAMASLAVIADAALDEKQEYFGNYFVDDRTEIADVSVLNAKAAHLFELYGDKTS
jgi:hypothetical protein